jgi:serralysin
MTTPIFAPPIAPENNPFADANFFDLNFDASQPDDVELTAGLLNAYPGGLRALDGNDTVVGSSDGETVNGNGGVDILFGGKRRRLFARRSRQ